MRRHVPGPSPVLAALDDPYHRALAERFPRYAVATSRKAGPAFVSTSSWPQVTLVLAQQHARIVLRRARGNRYQKEAASAAQLREITDQDMGRPAPGPRVRRTPTGVAAVGARGCARLPRARRSRKACCERLGVAHHRVGPLIICQRVRRGQLVRQNREVRF
jgi:hypothetical protein